jgi:hypothetical protein
MFKEFEEFKEFKEGESGVSRRWVEPVWLFRAVTVPSQ